MKSAFTADSSEIRKAMQRERSARMEISSDVEERSGTLAHV